MRVNFKNVFNLDIRSLSLMRIGVGLTLLLDLFIRYTDLQAHYTDQGVLPLELLFRFFWLPEYFSIFNMGNSPEWTTFLFLTNAVCIIVLISGYKTRLFTILCWIFLVSIQNRNTIINQGGDDLLRLLLFWGIFLPWGNYFSIDAKTKPINQPTYTSVAGAGYILLLFSMYFFSALLKNGPEWTTEFTAIYYALSLDMIVLPFGKLIYQYPLLLKCLTATVYYIELCLPFVLFIPIQRKLFRWFFIVTIILFQIGISLTLFVGLFPLISVVALAGLLPSSVWYKFNVINESPYLKEPLWKSVPLIFLVTFSLYLNAFQFIPYELYFFEKSRPLVNLIRIDQRWGMFAPIVFRDDGWFVFEGKTTHSEIDIYKMGKPVNFEKPDLIVSQVKNDRWRKYQENILFVHNSHLRPYYCNWLLKEWNKNAQDSLKISSLNIVYMKEVTMSNYMTIPVSKEILCSCSN